MKIKFNCMACFAKKAMFEIVQSMVCDKCGATAFMATEDKEKHVFKPGDVIRLADDHPYWPGAVFTLDRLHPVGGVGGWLAMRDGGDGWFLLAATVQAATLIATDKPVPTLHDFKVGDEVEVAPDLLGKAFRATVTRVDPDGFYGKTAEGKTVFVSHHAAKRGLVKLFTRAWVSLKDWKMSRPSGGEVVADPVNPDLYMIITGLWG